jgi:peptidoglycan-associated lipoprotein
MRIFIVASCLCCLIMQSCSFTQKVKTGLQAYEVKQYAVAVELFKQEYEQSKSPEEKARLAFLTGESYSMLNYQAEAATWYKKAIDDGYGEEAKVNYADALKRQERYADALQVYDELAREAPGSAAYRSAVTTTKQALEWKSNPAKQIIVQSAPFNTTASEYAAQPLSFGKVLFTSDRDTRTSGDTYLWTGRAFSDLYIWNRLANTVEPYNDRINSADNDGAAVLSPDGQMLVFTRCFVDQAYDAWCKLMVSYSINGQWSSPVALPFIQEKVNYGQPAFAANGTTLFFASDVAGGQGGHDLYYTQMTDANQWSEPINLGSLVNSAGNEVYPTVYNDTLFYSSDHFAGLGGLDIFKTWLDPRDQWVPPINLRAPINSGGDDFNYVIDTFGLPERDVILQGYLTSSREGATRSDDIYSFYIQRTKEVPVEVVTKDTTPPAVDALNNKQIFISIKVVEPLYEIKDDPNSKVKSNRALPNGPIIITEGQADRRVVTDELGQLVMQLEWNKEYIFTARYRDHLASSVTINTSLVERNPKSNITTINQLFVLEPIIKNKEIVLENIFYDYDQWAIRKDAEPSLNKLSAILKTNPTIRIQLSSHTDCRGTAEYNQELSQKRAQAAIDYLKSVGIPAKRLEAAGLGESSPAVACDCESCTEEQHQINRRTTFKIID